MPKTGRGRAADGGSRGKADVAGRARERLIWLGSKLKVNNIGGQRTSSAARQAFLLAKGLRNEIVLRQPVDTPAKVISIKLVLLVASAELVSLT
jgi:hypothetical protein